MFNYRDTIGIKKMRLTCNKLFFEPFSSNNIAKLSISSIAFKLFEDTSINCKLTQFERPIVFISWLFEIFKNCNVSKLWFKKP
jgi:hypothetical protein